MDSTHALPSPWAAGPLFLADAAATAALGQELAATILRTSAGGGPSRGPATPVILLLQGDLGAGKTCLVQGLAAGLGIDEPITSPTFALAQHYDGRRHGQATALVHLDLYRLEQPSAADELFDQEEEEARSLGALMAVEWPNRLSFVPAGAWSVELTCDGNGRRALVRSPASGL